MTLVALVLTTAVVCAAGDAAFSSFVFVEEGGRVLLECDAWSSLGTNCTVSHSGTYSMYPWADGRHRNVSAEMFNSSHCACHLPPADAESVALVQIGGGATVSVRYVALWTLFLSRAPFLSEDVYGTLLISVHRSVSDARVSMVRPDGAIVLGWTALQSGRASEVLFPLSALPPEVLFEELIVTLTRANALPLQRTLIISRVRPPTRGTFVQIEYRRRSILVDGKLMIGSGVYDTWAVSEANLTFLAEAGVTWTMRYWSEWNGTAFVPWTAAMIENFMDAAALVGIKVMYSMHELVQRIAGQGNSSEAWQQVVSVIDKYKGHPALLGWYICDDCMTQWLIKQMHANVSTPTIDCVYRELKRLDPHHPIIGASESAMINVFTQPNVFVRGRSLDLVMLENYQIYLGGYGFLDGWGPNSFMKNWPLSQEPIVNCPAAWYAFDPTLYPGATEAQQRRILYSFSWLALVMGNTPYNLPFRLFPQDEVWGGPKIRSAIIEEVGRFARIIAQLSDYLYQPPSPVPEPALETLSPSSKDNMCVVCAGVWRQQNHVTFCAAFAVVNTLNITTTVTLRLAGAERWPEAMRAPLRRLNDADEPDVNFVDGILELDLSAYYTAVLMTRDCGDAIFI